jgi:hypothetical protein
MGACLGPRDMPNSFSRQMCECGKCHRCRRRVCTRQYRLQLKFARKFAKTLQFCADNGGPTDYQCPLSRENLERHGFFADHPSDTNRTTTYQRLSARPRIIPLRSAS